VASRPSLALRLGSARLRVLLAGFVGLVSMAALVQLSPQVAHASSAITQERGFDTCGAPSTSTMQTWWNSSPYYQIGIYIGGSNRSCSQPNLTASWVTAVNNSVNMTWGLLPIWVGPQMPNPACQTLHTYGGGYISTNTTTANTQGQNEAFAAYTAISNLGMNVTSTPIAYDLEGNNNSTGSTCTAAAKAFIDGWDFGLSQAPAQQSGVYGSAAASYFPSYPSLAHPPKFIYFAEQNATGASTKNSNYIPTTSWALSQRHKQYDLNDGTCSGCDNDPADDSFGGITISVDVECSNGPVYSTIDRHNASSICIS
jgi:hypothetical protein